MIATVNKDFQLTFKQNLESTASTKAAGVWYKIKGETEWAQLKDSESYTFTTGKVVYFKGDNPDGFTIASSRYPIFGFTNGDISLSGNVMALLNNGSGQNLDAIPNPLCFSSLFNDSNAIVNVDQDFLPATTLANNCYYYMFDSTSLTNAPELPATNLDYACYFYMFEVCPNLNSIKIHYTGNFTLIYTSSWVEGVAANGIFYYNGSDTTRGDSAIPGNDQTWPIKTF